MVSLIKRQPLLAFGFFTILIFSILAIFAYTIIPDRSKNANRQHLEIALASSGYSVKIFEREVNTRSSTAWSWISGYQDNVEAIPYDSVQVDRHLATFYTPLGTQNVLNFDDQQDVEQFISDHTHKKTFWLGTDKFGRDMLSRLMLGIRISLLAGLLAVLVSLVIGLVLGSLAGYYQGWIDQIVLFLINIIWSIPTILLVFAIVLAFGRGLGVIFLAVGLTMWVDVARIVRGQVIAVKELDFITAAKSIGQSDIPIIWKHILPNIIGPILVIIAANFATAILIEAGLSYLGFGVNPPVPSLGNILNENYAYALSGNIGIALMPALCIMLLVLSFNLIGSGLRDVFDVRKSD